MVGPNSIGLPLIWPIVIEKYKEKWLNVLHNEGILIWAIYINAYIIEPRDIAGSPFISTLADLKMRSNPPMNIGMLISQSSILPEVN